MISASEWDVVRYTTYQATGDAALSEGKIRAKQHYIIQDVPLQKSWPVSFSGCEIALIYLGAICQDELLNLTAEVFIFL